MIDTKKRDTLKIISASAAVAAAPSLLNAKILENASGVKEGSVAVESANELANIDIKVRVSVTSNDLELLVTNTGQEPTNITQLTPSRLQTARGYFDLESLLANGQLGLNPGDSVTVPLTKRPQRDIASLTQSKKAPGSLINELQERVSIITDNDAFAVIRVSRMPYFV